MNPLEGMAYIHKMGEAGRERGQQSRLAALASQAYAAPVDQQRGLVQQAIATNPDAGFGLGKSLQDDKQQRLAGMSQKARMLVAYAKSGNRAGVDGLYPQIAQEAQALGLGQNIPTAWDDAYLPGIEQLAMMGGAGTASGVQSTYVDAQGNRVAIMRDGSTSVLGQNDAGMSQQTLNVDINGVPTQVTFDKRTGRYTTASLGGAPSQPQVPAQAPAGVYIDPSLPPEVQQQIAAAEAAGQQVPSQMYFGGRGQSGAPLVGRTKEAEAAAVEAAKQGVQLSYLPAQQAIETQGAIERTRGTEQAKAEIERGAEQQKRQREQGQVFAQYQAAISGLRSGLANSATGPLAGRLPALTANQQIAEGSVAALAPVLKQLFRAAGEGTFTDRDQALLLEMVPTRTDLPAAREAKLQNIDNIVRAKLGQGGIYGAAPADAPQSNAIPAPGHTEGGYRFRGGNPADPNSWERI